MSCELATPTVKGRIARQNIVGPNTDELTQSASCVIHNHRSKGLGGTWISSDLVKSSVCPAHPVVTCTERDIAQRSLADR